MWDFYFKILNLLGFFIPNWKNVFVDLPQLIRTTNWVKEYEDTMRNYGLEIHTQELTWSSSTIIIGIKMA